jgi:hypothetical protein
MMVKRGIFPPFFYLLGSMLRKRRTGLSRPNEMRVFTGLWKSFARMGRIRVSDKTSDETSDHPQA